MSTRSWVLATGLAVIFFTRVGLAQVVLLDFKGDAKGKLHKQLEKSLRAERMKVVPVRRYKAAAARKRVKGAASGTSASVAALAPALRLSAVVKGGVSGRRFHFVVLDDSGRQVTKGSYSVTRGLLSSSDARKFADRVMDSARGAPTPPPAAVPPPPAPPPEAKPPPEAEAPTPPPPAQTLPELDLSQGKKKPEEGESQAAIEAGEATQKKAEERPRGEAKIGPSFVSVQLTGLTTWRSYCSRPGVTSCSAYDALSPGQRATGDTVDFKPGSPYAGLALGVDFFPLAKLDSALNGLGISGSFGDGFSTTNVTQSTGTTSQLSSSDVAFSAAAVYRFYFGMALFGDRLPAYAGVHAGYSVRNFNVSSAANSPVLSSHRSYPIGGVEAGLPFFKFLRLELGFNYFLSPKAGSTELARYGTSVSSSGLGFEAGFAGDLFGPIGYTAKLKYARYSDTFSGAGASWQNGGVAQETYTGLVWGVTASF